MRPARLSRPPVLLAILLALLCVGLAIWLLWGRAWFQRTPGIATSDAVRRAAFEAPPLRASESLTRIGMAVAPREDQIDLALRYKGLTPEQTRVTCQTLVDLPVGAERAFTLSNQDTRARFEARARLQYKTDNVYMWVQTGPERVTLDADRLRMAAERFQREVYPALRSVFGSEAKPGVDCDDHIHIVHVTGIGTTVGGYFTSTDAYPKAVRSDSNMGQVYVIHAAPTFNGSDPGSASYMATLAHEFQHMIAANTVHATEVWIEEGVAQFAERLTGYGPSKNTLNAFAATPETQLNAWSESSAGGNSAHYGASYLFWSYLFDRFGEDAVGRMLRHPQRSTDALMGVLGESVPGARPSFEALFADWTVANLVGKNEAIDARYSYGSVDLPEFALRGQYGERDLPLALDEALPQFGAHYIELRAKSGIDLNVTFRGSRIARILPTDASNNDDAPAERATDNPFWWSGRSDASNPQLTRAIDLRNVAQATLTFKVLYRLERSYDYGYASVSADGGRTWATLRTQTCSTDNPQNANLGCGWTGASGPATSDAPRWVAERADLSAYAGKQILLRFEVTTDTGTTREGLAIDDIAISEIGWRDDASSDDRWTSAGFARVSNALPQRWSVRAVVYLPSGGIDVRTLNIDAATGAGALRIPASDNARGIVLIVSPITRYSTEPGFYSVSVE
jgi:immune inhibitor A